MSEENTAAKLLNEDTQPDADNEQAPVNDEGKLVGEDGKPLDAGQLLREISKGKIKLLTPLRAHGQDVTELHFDFCALTSIELMDALDSVAVAPAFGVTNSQGLALFAAACEKCAPFISDGGVQARLYDAKDVKTRMSGPDAIGAVQLAKLFYQASNRAGSNNISKE